jgi:hypothetical protein
MRYIILSIVLFCSCAKQIDPNPLIGNWEIKYYTQYGKTYAGMGIVQFLPNGSFMIDSTHGNYRIDGGKIHFWYNQCGVDFRVNGDTLVVNYQVDKSSVYGSCLIDLDITTTLVRSTDTISAQ